MVMQEVFVGRMVPSHQTGFERQARLVHIQSLCGASETLNVSVATNGSSGAALDARNAPQRPSMRLHIDFECKDAFGVNEP